MTPENAVAIITTIVALIGALASFFTLSNSARKDAFERLEKIVERLQNQVDELQKENDDLRDWANRLVSQLQNAGIQPAPFRPRRKKEGQ